MNKKHPANRLIKESSPYLQQHAYNPVDWYPWGEEAFAKAKQEDKPILVSIGYSTCHWCHVMERESFEDENIAAIMNEKFVCIKVDREERPDVDAIYMEAVMLVQDGNGGWPLNCFLLPNGKPFFGGTYFPPQPAYRRASWTQVLENLHGAYTNRREELEKQADQIVHYIKKAETNFVNQIPTPQLEELFDKNYLKLTFENLQNSFDSDEGGFGGAPKFPGTMALRFCLNQHLAEGNLEALNHLTLSLDKMCQGGIYDQLRGGFARYTVDAQWLVPHFEKMLYDNALLIGLLADTYKLVDKELYHRTILGTLEWVEEEMTSPEGLFYSALDADSEGVEGKFYVWSKSEIDRLLENPRHAFLFCEYYGVTKQGNWEHTNILNVPVPCEQFLINHGLDDVEFGYILGECHKILLAEREKRIRPGLDDKILLDWNAMMITAYCKAYQALHIAEYKECALRALDALLEKFRVNEESSALYHSYKEGKAKHPAFLDDYALVIEALLEANLLVQHNRYLDLAKQYADYTCEQFLDYQDQLFYFTSAQQQDIILHKKSLYDNATPSGNATMVHNLQQLSFWTEDSNYQIQAQKTLANMKDSIQKYPQSFGRWGNAIFKEIYPWVTVTLPTNYNPEDLKTLQEKALFNTLIKVDDSNTAGIIVCKDFACSLPVQTLEEALQLIMKD